MCGGLLIRNPNKIRVLRAALFHTLRGNAHSPRVLFGLRSVNSKRAIYKCNYGQYFLKENFVLCILK